jgi:hypothetical protein
LAQIVAERDRDRLALDDAHCAVEPAILPLATVMDWGHAGQRIDRRGKSAELKV